MDKRKYDEEVVERINTNLRYALKEQALQTTEGPSSKRATGVTTRLIDAVIQYLFVHGEFHTMREKLFSNIDEVRHFIDMLNTRIRMEHPRCEIQTGEHTRHTLNIVLVDNRRYD